MRQTSEFAGIQTSVRWFFQTVAVFSILTVSLLCGRAEANGVESKADATLRILLNQAADAAASHRPDLSATDLPRTNYSDISADSKILMIVEGQVNRAALEALGAEVNTEAGSITTIVAPLKTAAAISALAGVDRISAASAVLPQLDVTAAAVDANKVWGGSPPYYTGTTGRGVVVGIVDGGLDLNHADFRTSTGMTRVKFAWDQTWVGTKPAGFTYGAEYTESMINAGQASSFQDTDGHGTHVTSIAAGNGRATGNGQPDYRYIGMAPEADLVIVKTNFTDAGIIDGVNYIFQKAAQLGRPAVVNLSVGSEKGGHDGSYSMDAAISALTGAGRLVTAAAGNFGNVPIHAGVNVTSVSQTQTLTLTVPTYTPTTVSPENVFVEGWHDPGASFQVKLRSPSGVESNWITPGTSSGYITNNDGSYSVDNDITADSRGAKQIAVTLYRASTTSAHPAMGQWSILLTRLGGTTSGLCDFWVSSWKLATTTSPGFTTADYGCSVTSPATGDAVIATGAYATKSQWTNGSGGTSTYGNLTLGAIADFSSHGPRRDGLRKPDIVAPGYGVAAALSANAPTSNSYKVLDQVHYMRIGTSQANAHTTGVLALLLQQTPSLTPADARQQLTTRARKDSYTGTSPNDTYGYGKLDVLATVSGVTEVAPQVFHFTGPYPNPLVSRGTFRFTLSGEDLGGPGARVNLKLFDVSGRLLTEMSQPAQVGLNEWTWSGETTQGVRAAGGVYFARLQVGKRVAGLRFVKLQD